MRASLRPEAALAHTRRRLILVTLALVVGLLLLAGGAAAALANRALDIAVDDALASTVAGVVTGLESGRTRPAPTRAADGSPARGDDDGDDGDDRDSDDDHESDHETDREEPAAADTVLLELDGTGRVLATRAAVSVAGLPHADAVSAAAEHGRDLRTVRIDGHPFRVLTVALDEDAPTPVRFVQAAFVLTLHDQQVADLLQALFVVVVLGMLGAAIVAWAVVDRALAPVRAAVDRERGFVAAASHELRTPVSLIRSSAEVLHREGLVRPEGADLAADIEAEADRLGRLVADLTTLATAEAAPLPSLRAVDLAAIAADVVRRSAPLAAEHDVQLEFAAERPIAVRSDPDRVLQVALILVDNALRVTPRGRSIRVRAMSEPGAGALAVEDDGPGVDEADRARIFEPFVRGAARRDEPRAGGSGLGLAIARTIVERLGGRIRLEAPARGGARFVVALPRA